MKKIIFDTETSGLFKGRFDINKEPYMVQFAAKLYDGDRVVRTVSSFVKPIDRQGVQIKMPTDAFFIDNGLTDDVINTYGAEPRQFVPLVYDMFKKADAIYAHNTSFDMRILEAFIFRVAHSDERANELMQPLRDKPKFCTMQTLTDICAIPYPSGRRGNKWPKLEEAYKILIDPKGFDGAHDAMNDVNACCELINYIEKEKIPLCQI